MPSVLVQFRAKQLSSEPPGLESTRRQHGPGVWTQGEARGLESSNVRQHTGDMTHSVVNLT